MSFKKTLFIADKLSGHQLAGDGGAHDGTGACVVMCVSLCWLAWHGVGTTTLAFTRCFLLTIGQESQTQN